MLYEFIIVIWNDCENRAERKYGIVYGENEGRAMGNLGNYFGEELIRVEYFGSAAEDVNDAVYIFNDEYADKFEISGRKFGKTIPKLNQIPIDVNSPIYE